MYDMYKDPEEIKASTAPRQESAAPSKYMGDSEDTEPGYILTPNGKTTYYMNVLQHIFDGKTFLE